MRAFVRAGLLIWLSAVASSGTATRGFLDPEFDKVPFDKWLAGGGQTFLKWTVRTHPAWLSSHQRLMTQIDVQVDGAELARRRGQGKLMIFVQITDNDGVPYQAHEAIDLEKVEEAVASSNIVYTQFAFVMPGDYRLAVALYDTASSDHWVRKEKLHVAALKTDPLPQAWKGLPPVEFRLDLESPDSWYLPKVTGRLHLPIETRRPVQLEVLLNLTPSERAAGSLRVQDRNLSFLLPAVKTFSQVELGKGSIDVALLDLSRRRVTFHQEDVHELDWDKMREALAGADPGTIDVKSLQDRRHNARFFVNEVSRRIDGAGEKPPARAVIILSSSVAFEAGEDLRPIEAAPGTDSRVYYIRFHAERPRLVYSPEQSSGRHHHSGLYNPLDPRARPVPVAGEPVDQLANTLKPVAPRLFDVTTPAQFRKALATILGEIAGM